MALIQSKSNRARRLPGGSSLSIVRRWPSPLVGRSSYARALRSAMLDEQDDDHDGWQPIRLRQDEDTQRSIAGAERRGAH